MAAQLAKPGDNFTMAGIGSLCLGSISWVEGKDVTTYQITAVSEKFPTKTKLPPTVDVSRVVFGTPGYKKPYRGNLVGNIRIKYRIDDYAKLYVRDPHRIRCYLLKDMGEYVTHGIELEQTHRTQPRTTTNES